MQVKFKVCLMVLSVLFLVLPGVVYSGESKGRHVMVSLSEGMLNDFFQAVGKISGKGEKRGTKYKWTIIDPRIDIEPGQALFKARVKLKAGVFSTVEKARGKVDIQYIRESNRIRVKVRKAEVKLYFKLFGQKIPIGTIDVAKYYKPTFEFSGPQPIQKEVEVDLPNGKKRTIRIKSVNENLVLEKDRVTVYSDLIFTPVK